MTCLACLNLSKEELEKRRLFDTYAWHKAIWDCFPGNSTAKRPFLFRLNWRGSSCLVYILSELEPICPSWCPPSCWAIKKISPTFLQHNNYQFDLLANVTKKLIVHDSSGTRRKNGLRVPLIREDQQLNWLKLKGELSGFCIDSKENVVVDNAVRYPFLRRGKNGLHVGVRFQGLLSVTDRELFSNAFHNGIGTAKAFGFGMLLLQPIY